MISRHRALLAISEIERDAYVDGFKAGLAVAEKIAGWLARNTKRQREIRWWAELEISHARSELGLTDDPGPCGLRAGHEGDHQP